MTVDRNLGYPLHEHVLRNGLRVIVSPDRSAPVVAVNLWYHVGSKDERPGQTGVAHLFEHLMFQGSANVASGEHLGVLQANGASVNATTWFDRTNYFEAVPTGALDLALWLEADRMATTTPISQENLDTQRSVVKEEKRQRYDNVPYGDVIEHLLRLTFPEDHPYGHPTIGSMADLDAFTTESAAAFFDRFYVPGNCVLTLVGDIEPRDGFSRAKHFFGGIEGRDLPVRAPVAPLPPLEGIPRAVAVAPVPASAVYLSWRLPPHGTREFDACEIALDILGGSEAARLYRRLVHDDEIAESAGAAAMGLVEGTSFGFAFARAIKGTSLALLEDALIEQIRRLADEGPTDVELARVKIQFERQWLEQLARFDSRADLFGAYATLHGDPGLVNTRIAEIASVTREEVRAAAATYLRPENRGVLRYERGPLGGYAAASDDEGGTSRTPDTTRPADSTETDATPTDATEKGAQA